MPQQNHPQGTESAGYPAELDRRRAERFPCDLRPSWRVLGQGIGESWGATVHDISATGISLRVRCWIKPGTVLVVRLHGKGEKLSRPMPMRVMHATMQAEGEWLIGGMFVRSLTEEDLRELLQPA